MDRVLLIAIRSSDHLVGKGKPEAAATILENYLSAHAPQAIVLRRLGRIRLQQGRPRDAVVLLERALACNFESTIVSQRTALAAAREEALAASA